MPLLCLGVVVCKARALGVDLNKGLFEFCGPDALSILLNATRKGNVCGMWSGLCFVCQSGPASPWRTEAWKQPWVPPCDPVRQPQLGLCRICPQGLGEDAAGQRDNTAHSRSCALAH